MRSLLIRRLGYLLIALFVIITANFALFRLMPADPVSLVLAPEFTPEVRQQLREYYGLDRPIMVQYGLYLKSMITFDFGRSFRTSRPVMDELISRLPNTLMLLGTSLVVVILIGIGLGIAAAKRRGSGVDMVLTGTSLFLNAMPAFFIALLLLFAFGYYLPWFPLRGTMSAPPPTEFWPALLDRVHHMVLPVASVVLSGFGSWFLYTRNNMLTAMSQDYVLTARAKGLPERRILYGHAFRSVLPPIVTLIFLALPGVITGAVITETIFSLHGVGRYLLDATLQQDYPAVQGAFYLIGLMVLGCNFLADLLYSVVDPRIKVR